MFDKEKYLKSNREICPYCLSVNIIGYQIVYGNETILQKIGCVNCNKQWVEVYKLTNIEEVQK